MIDITFRPEYVAYVSGFRITNSLLTSVVTSLVIMITVGVVAARKNPRGFVLRAARFAVYELRKLTYFITGNRRRAEAVMPLVGTFFIFIMTANLLALVPGFLGSVFVATPDGNVPLLRSPNSDLNTTLALALVAVGATQYFSLRSLGLADYFKRFLDLSGPIHFVMGFFELLSEGVKVISFSFRLFGNIFAGEVLLLVIGFLVPYLVPVPFMILEIFVGVIQAFIFAMLTLAFIRTASHQV